MNKVIIGVNSSMPIEAVTQRDDLSVMDQITLPNISGSFEVREVLPKGNKKTYHVMPVAS